MNLICTKIIHCLIAHCICNSHLVMMFVILKWGKSLPILIGFINAIYRHDPRTCDMYTQKMFKIITSILIMGFVIELFTFLVMQIWDHYWNFTIGRPFNIHRAQWFHSVTIIWVRKGRLWIYSHLPGVLKCFHLICLKCLVLTKTFATWCGSTK